MKIICPIFYRDTKDFQKELKNTEQSKADMIEIRLDRYLQNNPNEDLIEKLGQICSSSKKILYTIRTSKEGGEADLSDFEYEKLIHRLIDLKGLVDIEVSRLKNFETIPNLEKAVLSYHNFEKTPSDLEEIWSSMEKYHPYIQKIAVMPQAKEDVLRLMQSCCSHKTQSKKIAISMSQIGKISRIIGDVFESDYTFASLYTSSAPGQVSIDNLVDIMSKLALS